MPWTLRDLKEYVDLILKHDPKAIDHTLVFETKVMWSHYHLSDGCALRGQHGKPNVIIFRLPE